ncbi:MAG: hypothetical protein CVU39_10680 [Chloroflexi bacterium HGW-Chloroflexi-10]|nr:MAG: hypothetical protein CVU39_10680 [Chloroflexi bacterium HGW-Chloroflexi-10]
MKNRFLIFVILGILALTSLACSVSGINVNFNNESVRGSGNLESETREVSGVTAVSLTGIGNLRIEYGDEEKLVIDAEDNLLPYITSEVRNGELILGTQDDINISPTEKINYLLVVTQELEELSVSGLGNIEAPALTTARLDLNVSGAGDIELDGLTADELNVNISGLGSIFVDEGQIDFQEIEISGSGKYEAEDVESREARIRIGGLGSANVWVTDELDAGISGSGNIEYYGQPSVRQDISGLGKLRSQGEH